MCLAAGIKSPVVRNDDELFGMTYWERVIDARDDNGGGGGGGGMLTAGGCQLVSPVFGFA